MSVSVRTWVAAAALSGMVACPALGEAAGTNTWYVDDDATPGGNGLSWATAFTNLDDAIESAVKNAGPDVIRVATGRYVPTVRLDPDVPQSATFLFTDRDAITIEGGFQGAGGEFPNRRTLDPTETVIDGALEMPAGAAAGEACNPDAGDCFQANGSPGCDGAKCCAFICGIDPFCCEVEWDETCAEEATLFCGMPAPPNVHHLVTVLDGGQVRFDGFHFINADATADKDNTDGAAAYVFNANATFVRCRFTNNIAEFGGAIAVYEDQKIGQADLIISNSWFEANHANHSGGGIFVDFADAHVIGSVLMNNTCDAFPGGGGAIFNGGLVELQNSTVVANLAGGFGGGIRSTPLADVLCTNSILWGNADFAGNDEQAQLRFGDIKIDYSCVQGWTGGLGGVGNIDHNPAFMNPPVLPGGAAAAGEKVDLRLQPTSPCIDAGSSGLLIADIADVDLDGNTKEPTPRDFTHVRRAVNNPFVDNGGEGGIRVADMGAMEFPPITGDVDADGDVDPYDLAELLSLWGPCGLFCDSDIDKNWVVDGVDARTLIGNWTSSAPIGLPRP
ncbi:MAG: hypothetical protein KDA25_01610 [Phycisphaerales bacterium]|nr:hypothetical protein [Phycisphaerales bacterium]